MRTTKSAETFITAMVTNYQRLQNDENGNPRYQLTTDQGVFNTKSGAQCAYSLTNGWGAKGAREAVIVLLGKTRKVISEIAYTDGDN